jgi:hypothetical protein
VSDRFEYDIELPDVAADPVAPAAGYLQFYGKAKRPTARNSDGVVIDMVGAPIFLQAAAAVLRPQIVTMIVQTAADGTLAVVFSKAFKAGTVPFVVLTPLATLTTQPTIAELSATPTNTGCSIKTYRTKTQGVLLGGTINPTQEQQAYVNIVAIGEAP